MASFIKHWTNRQINSSYIPMSETGKTQSFIPSLDETNSIYGRNRRWTICLGVFGASVIVIGLFLYLAVKPVEVDELPSKSHFPSCHNPSRPSRMEIYSSAAVSTDAGPCSQVANDILRRNGTAADAAVAAMFCVGVFNAQSCGLGGGFVATYYKKSDRQAYILNAREAAPAAAYFGMFDPEKNQDRTKWYQKKGAANLKGGLSVAVPGEVKGLYALYLRFGGGVPWPDLLQPTIDMCQRGYILSWYTGALNEMMEADLLQEASMSMFVNKDENRALKEGEKVYRKKLATTLRVLQKDPNALTKGPLASMLVKDLAKFGGIITEEDLGNYSAKWMDPVTFHLQNGDYKIHSFPPPGSGLVVGLILNILDEFNLTKSSLKSSKKVETHWLFAEALKFAYGLRSQLGDLSQEKIAEIARQIAADSYAKDIKRKIDSLTGTTSNDPLFYRTKMVPNEDVGTAHLSLVAPNGDAISITSSINMAYGAGIRSESTGVIFNNHMADFTTKKDSKKPGSMKMDANHVKPGSRPLSSMSPTIIVDKSGNAVLVVGAAGGIQIPSAIAWVMARRLWMDGNLKDCVDACRSHHNLLPMKFRYEEGFPKDIVDAMQSRGHVVESLKWKSVVSVLARNRNGSLEAAFDFRKSGNISGY